MSERKSKARPQMFLEMRDGRKLRVLGTTGRYWVTQGVRFKKNNLDILRVVTEAAAEIEDKR